MIFSLCDIAYSTNFAEGIPALHPATPKKKEWTDVSGVFPVPHVTMITKTKEREKKSLKNFPYDQISVLHCFNVFFSTFGIKIMLG